MRSKLAIVRRGKARHEDPQKMEKPEIERKKLIEKFCKEISTGSGAKVKSLDLDSLMPD